MDKGGDDSGNEKEREDTRDMLVAAIAKSNHQSKEQYLSTGIPVSRSTGSMNGKDEEVKKKLKLMAAAGNHHIGGPSFASMMAQQQQQLYNVWWCTDECHECSGIMMAYISISAAATATTAAGLQLQHASAALHAVAMLLR